jgi:cysteine desulfurase
VAKALGANDGEIYFTSGGTESNNLAILGALEGNKRLGKHIITTKIEHPSVLNVFNALKERGYDVTYLKVDSSGLIDLQEFKNSLRDDTALVSIMYVNNEVGTLQPIEDICKILRSLKNKPIFHVDAIQAFGKIDFSLKRLNVDLLSISGHKICGPKGIGALYIKKGTKIKSIIFGGNQESGIRSGTENVHGILGLGVAADIAQKNLKGNIKKMNILKNRLLEGIKEQINNIKINGLVEKRSAPHILNVSFLDVRGEVLLHSLEQDGIYVSTGSACSSRKKSYSHVLKAMGITEKEMEGAVRFSFSPFNSQEEIDYAIERLNYHVKELRKVIGGK